MNVGITGILKAFWYSIRNIIVSRRHARVAKFWKTQIDSFFYGKINRIQLHQKKKFCKSVIWQYWNDDLPFEQLPAVVQRGFQSVDKYKGDFEVIRLNNNNVSEYLELPSYVWNGSGESKFSVVFFSDLLRLALLHTYGGVWLDATVLLSKPINEEYMKLDHFVFQRDADEPNKTFWLGPHSTYWSWGSGYRVKMLNSIIFAKKESALIQTMLSLMLHYWKTQEKIINYFFFQILYDELINGKYREMKPPIESDVSPHILLVLACNKSYNISIEELFQNVGMHKLTYIDSEKIARLDKYILEAEKIVKTTE